MALNNYTAFRLSGIPHTYSKQGVKELVQRTLGFEAEAGCDVQICSLARDPGRVGYQIATLTLSKNHLDRLGWNPSTRSLRLQAPEHYNDGPDCDSEGVVPELVLDTHFHGFTPLHGKDRINFKCDFIAISGLNGHAFGSFKARGREYMWLRDALPQDLPDCRIFIYGYDTQLAGSTSSQSILDLGARFHASLGSLFEVSGGNRDVLFLGHSLGGLVLEEAINRMVESSDTTDKHFLKSIRGIMLFGVPQLGMSATPLKMMVVDQPNQRLVESLQAGSEFLESQQRRFKNALRNIKVRVVAFYETKQSRTVQHKDSRWQLAGPLTLLVEKWSAIENSHEQIPIDRDHSEIVKFTERYGDDYQMVVTYLRKLLASKGIELTKEQKETIRKQEEMQKKALQSLAFPEQHWRRDEIATPDENTCDWLIEHPNFKSLLQRGQTPVWIQGKPGSGKSTLMKYALDFLNPTGPKQVDGPIFASFFCHNRGSSLQKSKLGLFRSLLNQILAHASFPTILAKLASTYHERYETRGEANAEWTEGELQDFFKRNIPEASKSRRIFILIDALDECGEETASELVALFEKLVNLEGESREQGIESPRPPDLRILFSCRHYPVLSSKTDLTIIMEQENAGDIAVVVKARLATRFMASVEKAAMETKIIEGACGMFQWATVVTNRALASRKRGQPVPTIMKQIGQTPDGLYDLYETLWDTDHLEDRSKTIKLFQWILFAARPLSIDELQHALLSDVSMAFTSVSEFEDHYLDLEPAIKDLSKGLVETINRREKRITIAQFIHESVPEFLLQRGGLARILGSGPPGPLDGSGHFQLSRSCLQYLLLRQEQACLAPLSIYARRYWIFHLIEAERKGIDQKDLPDIFLWTQKAHSMPRSLSITISEVAEAVLGSSHEIKQISKQWAQDSWGLDIQQAYENTWREQRVHTNLAVLLTLAGIPSALKEMERRDPSLWDAESSEDPSLLLYAVFGRHERIIQDILVRPTAERTRVPTYLEYSPLYLVTAMGRSDLVQRILEAGADVNRLNGGTSTGWMCALFLAAGKGDEQIAAQLIDFNASINRICKDGWTALHAAAHEGHEHIVHLLLQRGALAFSRSICGQTPLHVAAYVGKESVVRVFLEKMPELNFPKDAFLDAKDNDGETAFLRAYKAKHLSICRRLAAEGVEIDAEDSDYEMSLLGKAVWYGDYDRAKFLLDIGADPNAGPRKPLEIAVSRGLAEMADILLADKRTDPHLVDIFGYSALTFAVSTGSVELVRTLLRCDRIDPNTPDQEGRTALVVAVARRGDAAAKQEVFPIISELNWWDSIVTMLVALGATDLNLADKNGDTPLTLAAAAGQAELVIKLLAFPGTDANLPDRRGHTPLALAVQNRHAEVVDLLLENEQTDPNLAGRNGETPLICAAMYGNVEIVKLLLEREDTDTRISDNHGWTALAAAVAGGYVDV